MPATAADIASATRPNGLTYDTQSSATIKARHLGSRDTADQPTPGNWDDIADAAAMNAERFALFGTERRRFALPVVGILALTGGLDPSQQTPTATLVDGENAVSADFLIARIELDLDAEATTLELFG